MEYKDLIASLRDIDSLVKEQIVESLEKYMHSESKKVNNINIIIFSYAYLLRLKTGNIYNNNVLKTELDVQYRNAKEYFPNYSEDEIKRNILRYFIFIIEMRI